MAQITRFDIDSPVAMGAAASTTVAAATTAGGAISAHHPLVQQRRLLRGDSASENHQSRHGWIHHLHPGAGRRRYLAGDRAGHPQGGRDRPRHPGLADEAGGPVMNGRRVLAAAALVPVLLAAALLAGCGNKSLPTAPDNSRSLIVLTVSQTTLAADGLAEAGLTATIDSDDPDPSELGSVRDHRRHHRRRHPGLLHHRRRGLLRQGHRRPGQPGRHRAAAQLDPGRLGDGHRDPDRGRGAERQNRDLRAFGRNPELRLDADRRRGRRRNRAGDRGPGRSADRPGQQVEISSSSAKFGDGTTKVTVPLGLDARAQTQLISPASPGSTTLSATVVGASQAPAKARHHLRGGAALGHPADRPGHRDGRQYDPA